MQLKLKLRQRKQLLLRLKSTEAVMLQIAKILKSNGTDGGVLMGFRGFSPEDIDQKEPVFIHYDGLPVPFFIEDFQRKGNGKAIVHLTNIRSFEDAEEIVGRAVCVDYEFEAEEDESFASLVGWTLKGVGEITGFLDIPANPCIEVNTKKGTAVVPFHEDLILSVDRETKIMEMTIPEGLLDL